MIIACPACATRYAVPDSAIGVEGRTVRCAKCRHSWHQDGPDLSRPEPVPDIIAPVAMPPATPTAPPLNEAPMPADMPVSPHVADYGWHTAPAAPPPAAMPSEPPAPPSPLAQAVPAPETKSDFASSPSSFAHQPPFRPRRNPARMWTALAIGFALVTTGAMGAVAKFGLPDWLPLPQSGNSEPDLKLAFPPSRQERRALPNGNDFFNISGTITNVGQSRRTVPVLLITLRDARNRTIYTVEAEPPKSVLAPGESEAINTAIIDAPKPAKAAEIQWKPH